MNQSLSWNGPIADEKNRSDDSGKTILPESLVSRVRVGKQTIGLSIAAPTTVLLDIDTVRFRPWCVHLGSNTDWSM
jgi:hypothetical protein